MRPNWIPFPLRILKNLLRPFYYAGIKIFLLCLRGLFALLSLVLGKRLFLKLLHVCAEQIDTTITTQGIVFDGRYPIPFFRAITAVSKEPDTIAWIDDFFADGDIFFDVGANVGVFSLYAAKKKHSSVIAFEPS